MAGAIFNFGIGLTLVGSDDAVAGIEGIIDRFQDLSQELNSIAALPGVDMVARSAREAGEDFDEAGEQVDEFDAKLSELRESANEVRLAFAGIGDAVMGTNIFDLEHQAVRLTARLGEGRESADAFQKSVLDVASSTQTSATAVGDIAFQLRAAGMEFDTSTEAGRNTAETLAYMADTMGLGSDVAAKFAASGRLMGASVAEMRDEALLFEKVYNIPGLLEQMPAAAETAIAAQAMFGKEVVGDTKQAAFAVTKMAGQFSKALGKTTADAIKDAQENFMAFTGEISSFEDVFLGLSDSFSPLQKALFETGQGVGDVQRLLKLAQKDPLAFADSIDRIKASLDPLMARRLEKQMLAGVPEATRQIIMFERQRQEAIAAGDQKTLDRLKQQEKAAEQQEKFNKLIGEMRGNVVDARSRLTELMKIFQAEVGVDFAKSVSEGLEDMVRWLGRAVNSYREFRDSLDTEKLQKVGVVIGGVVTAGVAAGPVFAALSGFIKPLASGFSLIWKTASKLTGALLGMGSKLVGVTKAAGASRGILRAFGAVIGKLALPLGLIISAIDGFKDEFFNIIDILSDPNASGAEKIEKVFREVVSGLWDTFDNFFLGLPNKFIEGFNSMGAAVNTDGAKIFGESIGNALGSGLVAIKNWFNEDIYPFFENIDWQRALLGLVDGTVAVGKQVFAVFSGISEGILNSFGFTNEHLPAIMDSALLEAKILVRKAIRLLLDGVTAMTIMSFAIIPDAIDAVLTKGSGMIADFVRENRILIAVMTGGISEAVLPAVEATNKLLAEGYEERQKKRNKENRALVAGLRHATSENLKAIDQEYSAERAIHSRRLEILAARREAEQKVEKARLEGLKTWSVAAKKAEYEVALAAEALNQAKLMGAMAMVHPQDTEERDRIQGEMLASSSRIESTQANLRGVEALKDAAPSSAYTGENPTGATGGMTQLVRQPAPTASAEDAAAAAGGQSGPSEISKKAGLDVDALGRLVKALEGLVANNATTQQARTALTNAFDINDAKLSANEVQQIKLTVNPNVGRLLDAVMKGMEAEAVNGTRR